MSRRPSKERIFGQARIDSKGNVRAYVGRGHPLADSHGEVARRRLLLWLDMPDTGDTGNGGWIPCAGSPQGPGWNRAVANGGVLVNWRLRTPDRSALYVGLKDKTLGEVGGNVVPLCRRHAKRKPGPCGAG